MDIVSAHGLHHHILQHHHALLHQNLLAVRPLFQVLSQVDTGPAQDHRHNQKRYRGLGNGNAAEYGNGKIDKCAVNTDIHTALSPGFLLKNSHRVRVNRTNTRGITRAITLQMPLLAKATSTTAINANRKK